MSRIIILILALLGRLLAGLPVAVPEKIARAIGWLIFNGYRSRRRVILSNLHHAFPERDEAWRRATALESCRRTVEMGLFVLASPYFSVERIQRMFTPSEAAKQPTGAGAIPAQRDATDVVLVPHFSLMEATTLIHPILGSLLRDEIEIGVFYRPFGNAALERWVKQTRERFNLRLLSRRDGYTEASGILRRNGRIAILFDQHAGAAGTRTLFMRRLAQSSGLAGLLAEKHRAGIVALYIHRRGFWRGELSFERLLPPPTKDASAVGFSRQVTLVSNIWLEEKMRGDDNFCADWLWLHKRWKISTDPRKRLALRTPRHDLLAENIAALHLDACPRNEHFWVRLPRNLAGAIRTIPLLRALRRSRPDAALTLLVDAALAPLFEATGLGERVIALPAPTAPADEFRAFFKQQRTKYPDTWIVFPEDAGADLEARLAGAPQRFGMITAGGPLARRPNLTHVWRVPKGVDLQRVHQSLLWELWLKSAHGLDADADFSPLRLDTPKASAPLLSLLIGGDGDRRRTWSAGDWAEFIRQLRTTRPDVRLRLLGARCDQPLAEKITAALADTGTGATGTAGTGTAGTGTAAGSIQNWTGQLEITAAARALAESHAVVGTDNGLLRLANLLGVPAVALFVSTNPLRTAPNFTAPLILLQPSQSGTAGITGITTENVRIAAETLLH